MGRKAAILSTFFIVFLLGVIAAASGQNSTSDLVALSTNSLTLSGEVGEAQLTTRIGFIGIANESVNVKVFPVELRDDSSGATIPATNMEFNQSEFELSPNELVEVSIRVAIAEAKAGTYRGAIIVTTALGNNQIIPMNIDITVKVKPEIPFISPMSAWLVGLFILVVVALGLGLMGEPRLHGKARALISVIIVLVGILAVYAWIYIMINATLGELNTVIATMLVTPFAAYVINYVNEKRKDSNEKGKTSREIHRKGIEADIETIRNILGELATHFASFKPNLYEEAGSATVKTSARVLYNKDGLISRSVWDPLRKQGMMVDLPIFELERYHDFVSLYNRYYSCAMMQTENKTETDFERKRLKPFFVSFEDFRNNYGELEKVLFVHLTYYLGLYIRTNLLPIEVEYPRVTRTLLRKLVDYGILEPEEHFAQDYARQDEATKDSLFNDARTKFNKEFQNKSPPLAWPEKQKELDEKYEEFNKFVVKELIDKWNMTAKELAKKVEIMYKRDKIPIFYRKVEDDFQEKYKELKASAKKLAPLPDKCIEKELADAEERKAVKLTLVDLDTLKKLLDSKVIKEE